MECIKCMACGAQQLDSGQGHVKKYDALLRCRYRHKKQLKSGWCKTMHGWLDVLAYTIREITHYIQ